MGSAFGRAKDAQTVAGALIAGSCTSGYGSDAAARSERGPLAVAAPPRCTTTATPPCSRARAWGAGASFVTPTERKTLPAGVVPRRCGPASRRHARLPRPEILLCEPYGPEVDWWALGVVGSSCSWAPPFHAASPVKIFENILSNDIAWPPEPALKKTPNAPTPTPPPTPTPARMPTRTTPACQARRAIHPRASAAGGGRPPRDAAGRRRGQGAPILRGRGLGRDPERVRARARGGRARLRPRLRAQARGRAGHLVLRRKAEGERSRTSEERPAAARPAALAGRHPRTSRASTGTTNDDDVLRGRAAGSPGPRGDPVHLRWTGLACRRRRWALREAGAPRVPPTPRAASARAARARRCGGRGARRWGPHR